MSTYMEIVESDDANPNTIKEPAKRWRNWYRATLQCNFPGEVVQPGALYRGDKVWPSRDVAESKAFECAMDPIYPSGKGKAKYVGAFPEGERP